LNWFVTVVSYIHTFNGPFSWSTRVSRYQKGKTNLDFYRAMLCIHGTSHGPVSVRPSLRPSVRPSQVGVLLKRLNIGSHKQHHTIVWGLWFSEAKDLREIRPGSPPMGAPNAGGVDQNRRFSTNNRLYLENCTRQTHGFY